MVGIFGIPTTEHLGTYLGTPIFTTCQTASAYQYLVDKIQKKIEGWQAKYLSMADRATLLYVMQTTQLPQKVSQQLDKIKLPILIGRYKLAAELPYG